MRNDQPQEATVATLTVSKGNVPWSLLLLACLFLPSLLVVGGCGLSSDQASQSGATREASAEDRQAALDDPALPPSAVSEPLPVALGSFTEQLAAGRAMLASQDRDSKAAVSSWSLDSIQTDHPITDQQLAELSADDAWLENLLVDEGEVSDQGLQALVELPNLSHLRLRRSPIGDQGLVAIAELAKLRVLNLPQSQVTSGGLRALAKNTTLRSLRLGGERLNSTAAESLAGLKTLNSLHLIDVPIDDAGLRTIMTLPDLQSLYIDGSEITQEGWDWLLQTHPKLHLHVNQQHLDRDPNKHQHD